MTPKVKLPIVAIQAFGLGAVFMLSSVGVALQHLDSIVFRVSFYTLFTSIFHFLEFLTTAWYNPDAADDDSFILRDSDLYYIYIASVIETVIVHKFWKYSTGWLVFGCLMVVSGQICRSVAMATAGESFNHYVQRQHTDKHKLVTDGIYRHLRHPSYFGYFWWYVGLQMVLQNGVMAAAGAYKLQRFFSARITYEEELLVTFFGDDYRKYAASTKVGIPGIA